MVSISITKSLTNISLLSTYLPLLVFQKYLYKLSFQLFDIFLVFLETSIVQICRSRLVLHKVLMNMNAK